MESYEKFYTATFVYNRAMLRFVGHDIYDKNFKPSVRSYFMYLIYAIIIGLVIYTVIISDNFTRLVNIFNEGLLIQVNRLVLMSIFSNL